MSNEPQDTPAEAAVVEAMRESGTLSRWAMTEQPPAFQPKIVHKGCLQLAGGLEIHIDDEYHSRFVTAILPRDVTNFPWDSPLNTMAAELPGRLLPVLRAAVADLEQIVARGT